MKNNSRQKGDLLLSIHDVSPFYEKEIREIITDLINLGVTTINLGVVPNFHNRFNLKGYESFAYFINRNINIEKEILIHGYYHKRLGENEKLPFFNSLLSRLKSDKEDEFYKLSPFLIKKRIKAGIQIFKDVFENAPNGFIPPAWIFKNHHNVQSDLKIDYFEDHFFIYQKRGDKRFFSPILSFSTRDIIREKLSIFWVLALRNILCNRFILRFVIHPSDYRSKRVKKTILETIERLKKRFNFRLYRELFI